MVLNNTCECVHALCKNEYGLVYIHIYIHIYMCIYTCIHAYIYIYIHIYSRTHTFMDIYTYTYAYICTYTYICIYICICTHIHIYLHIYRICTSCSEREANVCADIHNICLKYTPAHTWCSTTPVNAFILSAKMHMDSCMRAYAKVQQLLCYGSYCELILSLARNIVQAVVCHPPSCQLNLYRPPPSLDAVRLRNPSKSTLSHDVVAPVVLHKHHLIIRVGAGLIQFVYGSRSHLAARRLHVTEMQFRHFRAS